MPPQILIIGYEKDTFTTTSSTTQFSRKNALVKFQSVARQSKQTFRLFEQGEIISAVNKK